jgi:photosystem II stability/assembly factor-like uncharacterized protein
LKIDKKKLILEFMLINDVKMSPRILLQIFFILNIHFIYAQKGKPANIEMTVMPGISEAYFDAVKWRQLGPFRGGRSCTATGVPGKPNLYYMGTVGGGVWRTIDGGGTWECISDGYFGGSIGAVAVAESDPNVIYVGEGEQTLRGNVSPGKGLWRSTDAGKTWKYMGLPQSQHISRIRIHPTNPDLIYVGVLGNLWKSSTERGLYRSKDGGKNWEKILYENDRAGCGDVVFDPGNPRIIFASTWEMKRNGYRMDSGGEGSHLYKSTDGGDTWINISKNKGLPGGLWGIAGLTISPANPERIWACIEAEDGGLFRSDNGGQSWIKTSEDRELRQRAWYYSRITADSENPDVVYALNVPFLKSTDGGRTFKEMETPHSDHHDLWIDPANNQRMIVANDGGAQVSTDGGVNWTTYHNQPTAQFYRVTTDQSFPFKILGAQQDNSTVRISHRSTGSTLTDKDWEISAGGESAHLAPDPNNPEVVYAGTYKGYMSRFDHTTGQERSTNVWPFNPAGSGVEVMKYRFNWNFPLLFSPHNPKKLYAGSNYLHVTTNEGQSWEVISPDLTRNDPETLKSSGGPITQDNTGVEFYGNIFVIAESPKEEGVIWTGSDDGLLHVTRDGGKTWQNVTPPGSPKWNMFNCIDVNPHQPGSAYVAATHYKFGDYTPYLYKTVDYGKTWITITKGIDNTHYTRAIRVDPTRKGLLYAGTEWGMYISFDDGNYWQPFKLNLPIVSIHDLHIRDNTLIAATHGRSFWMIDDLSPIQEMNSEIKAKDFHLFTSKPTYRLAQENNAPSSLKEGENHPNGAVFHFYINDLAIKSPAISLEIFDDSGKSIQKWSKDSKNSKQKLNVTTGGNRFVWDLRYPGFTEFPGMVFYSSPNKGPKVMPGNYQATLSVDGKKSSIDFIVLPDPRLKNTQEDYKKQLDYLLKVRDKVSEANQAILDIRTIKKDLIYIKEKLGNQSLYKDLLIQAEELEREITKIENQIHQTKNIARQDALNYGIKVNNRLAFLLADQQLGDFPPTDQAEEVYDVLAKELDGYLNQLKPLIKSGVETLNAEAQKRQIPLLKEKG